MHEGWQTFLRELVPKDVEHIFPVTLGHNDILDGNILMNVFDNRKLLIIDYEYTSWSPMGYDIGKYFNEVMMDHKHPSGTGIVCYLDNMLSYAELAKVCKAYLARFYHKHMTAEGKQMYPSQELYVESCLDAFVMRVYKCALLANFQSSLWAMSQLDSENCTKEGLFHYDFLAGRVQMQKRIQVELSQLCFNAVM